ncbi:MAG: hypothetical protein JWM56_1410 [Candidatus Peribacteria bacterium]|nr:hypothetical protein [Candidatus Peribacteria bacterium]
MNRETYRNGLIGLLQRHRLENPTPLDVASLCPHLDTTDIEQIFARANAEKSSYFAAPPLLVNHGYQILSVTGPLEYDGKKSPQYLNWSYTGRTLESYADGKKHGDVFSDYAFADKAIAYAQQHWGDKLILDDWDSYITTYLDDPRDKTKDGYPRTKLALFFVTKRPWNDLINDHHAPQSEVIDESILQMACSVLEGHELKGGRGGYTESNCANCGGGLALTGCTYCNLVFKDDHYRCGGNTPLMPKLAQYATANGHVFGIDPSNAREAERLRWVVMMRK